jgi:hypothetical protein
MEPEVHIRCLKRDIELVESVLGAARTEFLELVKREMNQDLELNILVAKDEFLHERELRDVSGVSVDDDEFHSGDVISKGDEDKKWLIALFFS